MRAIIRWLGVLALLGAVAIPAGAKTAPRNGQAGLALGLPEFVQTGVVPPTLSPPDDEAIPGALVQFDRATGFVGKVTAGGMPAAGRTPEESAAGFLKVHGQLLGVAPDLSNLVLARSRRSLGGYHLTYQQVWPVAGPRGTVTQIPVWGAQTAVHLGRDLGLQMVQSTITSVPPTTPATPRLGAADALALAAAGLGLRPPLRAKARAALVVYAGHEPACLCWQVLVPALTPLGDWEVLIDAVSGQVVLARDRLKFADGEGMVFDPNPITTSGNSSLTDNDDADYPALTNERKSRVLQGLDGSGYLQGPYANTAPTANRAHEVSLHFDYTRSDDRFEEVTAYYHIDACQRYLQSLGFTDVNNQPQALEVDGTTEDNSWYSPFDGIITYGTGGVDDAEDADVIIHEYGHAIQESQVPGFGMTNEGGAMGEGFSDYLAATRFAEVNWAWRVYVAEWDAVSFNPGNPPYLRRVDSTKHYPEDMVGEVHEDGEIWSACLWQMREALGATVADTMVIESHFYLTPTSQFVDGANAILQADQNLNGGANRSLIRTIFSARGIVLPVVNPLPGWPRSTGGAVYGSPALGDIDGDGTLEVVIAPANSKVYARHQDGTMVTGWPQAVTGVVEHCSPVLGDLDNDGDLEVVVATTSPGYVYAWHGDGTLVTGWPRAMANGTYASPALGDLDGDGDLEVVVPAWAFAVCAWHGDGTPVTGWPQAAPCSAMPVALGDLDGDARPEVVCACTDNTVRAWHGNGTVVAGWPQTTPGTISATPALGDVDGDGLFEVALACDGTYYMYVWNGDGTLVSGWPQPISSVGPYTSAALADLDGDDLLDIVIGAASKDMYAWRGDGTSITGWPFRVGGSPQDALAVADLEGDGQPEIMMGTSGGKVFAFDRRGVAVAGWPQTTSGAASPPVIADINGDGCLEVAAGSANSKVYVWRCDDASADVLAWPMFKRDASHRACYGGEAPGRIIGVVKDARSGVVLEGASVTVYFGDELVATAATDASGHYGVQEISAGVYSLTAQAASHTSTTHRAVAVQPGKTTRDDLSLAPTGGISGQVCVSGTTTIIPGATVEAYVGSVLAASTTSGSDGVYSMSGLLLGTYSVTARKQGYMRQTKEAIVTAGGATYVDFGLEASGRIAAEVKDKGTGLSIAGATVTASLGGVVKATGTTATNGFCVMDTDLATGTYVVAASKTGHISQTKTNIAVTQGASSYVSFNLNRVCLKGQVKESGTGTTLAGATVAAYQGDVLKGAVTTNASGSYEMASLAAGSYTVIASKAGYVRQTKLNITITDGVTTNVNFSLAVSGKLKGQVKEKGSGAYLIGATVLARMGGVTRGTTATTSPYGIYNIDTDLPPGTYVVQASQPGYVADNKTEIIVTAGATTYVYFNLAPGG